MERPASKRQARLPAAGEAWTLQGRELTDLLPERGKAKILATSELTLCFSGKSVAGSDKEIVPPRGFSQSSLVSSI